MAVGDFFSNLISGSASGMGESFGIGGGVLGAVGAAGSVFEGMQLANTQSQESTLSSNMAQLGIQENQLRMQQMSMNTNRQQMQNLRNLQRARASGMSAAVSSGAQFGSGIKGAQGAASAEAGTNELSTAQNFMVGKGMFGLMNQQAQDQMQMAGLQSKAATQQGIMSMFGGASGLGSGMMGGASSFGKLFGGFS